MSEKICGNRGRHELESSSSRPRKPRRSTPASSGRWGDLSAEIVPFGTPSKTGSALLHAFYEDYEVPWSWNTFGKIRKVCGAFPREGRKKTSFKAHEQLAYHPDRLKLIQDGLSIREAAKLAGRKPTTNIRADRVTAIQCANATKSWSKSLRRRMRYDEPSEDLIVAVSEAWYELSQVIDELGLYAELVAEFEHDDQLVAA